MSEMGKLLEMQSADAQVAGPLLGPAGGGGEPALRFSSSTQFTRRTIFGKLIRVLLGGRLGASETQTLSWRPVSSGWQSPITSLL